MAWASKIEHADIRAGLPAMLGLVAHSAYHLGAIRQLKSLAP